MTFTLWGVINGEFHISFGTVPSTTNPYYQIVIGGSGGSQINFRKNGTDAQYFVGYIMPTVPCNFTVFIDQSAHTLTLRGCTLNGVPTDATYSDSQITGLQYFSFNDYNTTTLYSNVQFAPY